MDEVCVTDDCYESITTVISAFFVCGFLAIPIVLLLYCLIKNREISEEERLENQRELRREILRQEMKKRAKENLNKKSEAKDEIELQEMNRDVEKSKNSDLYKPLLTHYSKCNLHTEEEGISTT